MTERERLIELLDNATVEKAEYYPNGTPAIMYCEKAVSRQVVYQLADYLLENGVIVPPCKVGDVVWLIGNMKLYTKEECCSRKVISVQRLRTGETLMHFKDGCFEADAIGVYVFFTKEEAVKALKGGGEE